MDLVHRKTSFEKKLTINDEAHKLDKPIRKIAILFYCKKADFKVIPFYQCKNCCYFFS